MLMYHQVSYGKMGTLEDHKREMALTEMSNKKYRDLVLSVSSIDEKTLKSYDRHNEDYYIPFEEALELGIVSNVKMEKTSSMTIEKVEMEG